MVEAMADLGNPALLHPRPWRRWLTPATRESLGSYHLRTDRIHRLRSSSISGRPRPIFPTLSRPARRLAFPAAGTSITLLMVSSSSSIACLKYPWAGQRRRSLYWLAAGLVTALGYPNPRYLGELEPGPGIDGGSGIFSRCITTSPSNHPGPCVLGHPRHGVGSSPAIWPAAIRPKTTAAWRPWPATGTPPTSSGW